MKIEYKNEYQTKFIKSELGGILEVRDSQLHGGIYDADIHLSEHECKDLYKVLKEHYGFGLLALLDPAL